MKSIVIIASALALTACAGFGPFPLSEAQKDAVKAEEFCKVPANKKTDLCTLIVNPHR